MTEQESLPHDAVMETLRDIVQGKEDYVYNFTVSGWSECAYSNADGTPSCIVGHVMRRLTPVFYRGVAELEYEEEGGAFINSTSAQYLFSEMSTEAGDFYSLTKPVIDNRTIRVLTRAQDMQDAGKTWGQALEAVEKM
jgi:hypothetical protein